MIIKLNVGGRIFHTSNSTLQWVPHTFFTALLSNNIPSEKDENGAYFIDRDPDLFNVILKYLRTKQFTFFENKEKLSRKEISEILHEAEFYGILPLIEKLHILKTNLFDHSGSSKSCGDIHYNGTISYKAFSSRETADQNLSRNFIGQPVQSISSIHNYIAVAYKTHALVYRYSDFHSNNFDLIYKTRPVDIEKICLSVKRRNHKLILATANSKLITLWLLDETDEHTNPLGGIIHGTDDNSDTDEADRDRSFRPGQYREQLQASFIFENSANLNSERLNQAPTPRPNDPTDITYVRQFQIDETCDEIQAMEFVCGNLIVLGKSKSDLEDSTIIAVWNSVNQQWFQQKLMNTSKLTSWQLSDHQMVVLGTEAGELKTIDMEKLPRRVHDSTLMINDLAADSTGSSITAVSAHTTHLRSQKHFGSCVEIAYGTQDGRIVVMIAQPERPQTGQNPLGENSTSTANNSHSNQVNYGLNIAYSSHCHEKPVIKIMLTANFIISVCSDNHVRTFTLTRFRGRLSNQAKPLASFNVGPILSVDSYSGSSEQQRLDSDQSKISGQSGSRTRSASVCSFDFEKDQKSQSEADPPVAALSNLVNNLNLQNSQNTNSQTSCKKSLYKAQSQVPSEQPLDLKRTDFNIGPHLLDTNHSLFDAIFIQQICQHYSNELFIRVASTGHRLCKIKAVKHKTNISTLCLMDCITSPGRLGSQNKRLLLSGHTDGHIEIWDLEPSIEKFGGNFGNGVTNLGNVKEGNGIAGNNIQLPWGSSSNSIGYTLNQLQTNNFFCHGGPNFNDLLRQLDRFDNSSFVLSESDRNSFYSQFSYDV